MKSTSIWKCRGCGYTVSVGYKEISDNGFPMCNSCHIECDFERESSDAGNEITKHALLKEVADMQIKLERLKNILKDMK